MRTTIGGGAARLQPTHTDAPRQFHARQFEKYDVWEGKAKLAGKNPSARAQRYRPDGGDSFPLAPVHRQDRGPHAEGPAIVGD